MSMAERRGGSAEKEWHAAKRDPEPGARVVEKLADAYRKEGLLDEAVRICRDGLAAHPASVGVRLVLGRALLEQGALEEAEGEFARVLELAPDDPQALRLLGDAQAEEGRVEEACQQYRRALQFNPFDIEVMERLAALPLTSRAEASEEVPSGGVAGSRAETVGEGADPVPAITIEGAQATAPHPDPLASPTLAGLYTSQGHTEVAEVIYRQLEDHPHLRTEVEILGWTGPDQALLEGLLSFREAARQLKRLRLQDPRTATQTPQ